ncbi:efflux RND transporter periplasmic adaptor subunit [Limnobaculum zhutongyuii]|uniref:Efflux RND transporter periplasmic adaptor subunit n=1 Tax=Limnobaculum zhutongyuii TaxID=2498113 RepID=A0A411WP47_9GAMM|nr:efflux RND transporter periplasmic adaptor subunit [Limnobaculum zhutongyuii]QBH97948.1 efflux RND transporter periplasmic adaptor subunit [Limnobaculum zhutongyuii]TQS88193.1 efflux RND transporter periplasmic adaptor subunit [Limnobaculum zhutongyuii]
MQLPTSKLRYVLIIAAILIAGWLIKLFFFPEVVKPNYITTPATKTSIEQTVLADGSIKALKQVNVGAQVSGQIKALHVELGDKVTKGQALAEIDDLPQNNDLHNAEAGLKSVQAQRQAKLATLKNNQLAFNRQSQILAKGVGAQADYDAAKAQLDATKAEIESLDAQIIQAQIAMDTAKLNLGYTKISSPIDGVVVAIPVEEGQTVNAVQSAPTILKVAQLDTMTIEAQISEADVPKVKTGMPVYFTILGEPGKHYSAKLRAIEPAPDSINSSDTTTSTSSSSTTTAIYYNGLFDVENPDGKLRISMTAQVYIVLDQAKDTIVIPTTALNDTDNQGNASVQVVDASGKVIQKKVKTGINNNVDVQIISGLEEGENVIVSEAGAAGSTQPARMRMRM